MNKNNNYISERKLYYCEKGAKSLKPFIIKVTVPFLVETCGGVKAPKGMMACQVDLFGIESVENKLIRHGVDGIQALNIATNLEPLISRLNKKFDIFWEPGEPYFGDKL